MIFVSSADAGSCGPKNTGGTAQNAIDAPEPSGTCPPSGGQLSGTVTATAPVTFCCKP